MDIMTVFSNVFQIDCLLLILVGVIIGNIFGCIPGLNTPIAIALVLPFSMSLGQVQAVCLVMGIYMGGVSGGLITAILLKIPGTAASVATTFDGYPMAQKGEGTKALTLGAFSSFFGGIFSSVMLLLLAPILSKMAIGFGPWEYFGTTVLALSMVCLLGKGNYTKCFISLGIGLIVKTIGASPVDGIAVRYSFGLLGLENGLNLVAVILGIFALPEIIFSANKLKNKLEAKIDSKKFINIPSFKDMKFHFVNLLRSSTLGTFIGILPGLGGGPAGMMAYSITKKTSKYPEEFGKGCPDGIVSAESANNATTGGALIPMLSLSVPGDTATAVIMGAFAIQGIAVGPNLSLLKPNLFGSIILAVFVANIFMFLYQATTLRYMSKILQVPRMYLLPIIVVFCVTGVYCLSNNVFDLYYTVILLVLGYVLDKNDYPIVPFIMAMVLGGSVEENLRRSITYYGSFVDCLKLPSFGTLFFFGAIIMVIIMVVLNSNVLKSKKMKEGLN